MKIDRVQILCHNVPVSGKFVNEITGRVVLSVHKQLYIKDDISITLEGKASVKFSSYEVNWVKKDNIDYSELQLHDFLRKLKHRRRLSDSSSFSEEIIVARVSCPLVSGGNSLKCGDNSFSFSFQLAPNLPSSFDSKHGSIKYKLKVQKKVYLTIHKIEVKVGSPEMITLLWQNPKWNTGLSFAGKMKDGEIVIGLYLNKTCFVIGETSQLTVEVNNQSNFIIYSLNLKFKQVMVWIGKNGGRKNAKIKEEVLSSFDFNSIRAKDVKQFTLNFTIPPVPYIDVRINTSQIIRIYNCFTVTGKYRELLSTTKCCIDVPVEIFGRTGPVVSVGPSSMPVGFIYQPLNPSSLVGPSAPSVNISSNSTNFTPLTVNMPPLPSFSMPSLTAQSFSVNPSFTASSSLEVGPSSIPPFVYPSVSSTQPSVLSPSFSSAAYPSVSSSQSSSYPSVPSQSTSYPSVPSQSTSYPLVPPQSSAHPSLPPQSSFQPSAPSSLPSLNPPSYSSLSDPPPPYPGTPPDLAESLQKLRFS